MEYANHSFEELQKLFHEYENKQTEIKSALQKRRQEGLQNLAQEVKQLVLTKGYEFEEIVPLVAPSFGKIRKKRSLFTRKSTPNRTYKSYVDPDNPEHVYIRGVLPGWMRKKMQELGYSPASKDDRAVFKSKYLKALESTG